MYRGLDMAPFALGLGEVADGKHRTRRGRFFAATSAVAIRACRFALWRGLGGAGEVRKCWPIIGGRRSAIQPTQPYRHALTRTGPHWPEADAATPKQEARSYARALFLEATHRQDVSGRSPLILVTHISRSTTECMETLLRSASPHHGRFNKNSSGRATYSPSLSIRSCTFIRGRRNNMTIDARALPDRKSSAAVPLASLYRASRAHLSMVQGPSRLCIFPVHSVSLPTIMISYSLVSAPASIDLANQPARCPS